MRSNHPPRPSFERVFRSIRRSMGERVNRTASGMGRGGYAWRGRRPTGRIRRPDIAPDILIGLNLSHPVRPRVESRTQSRTICTTTLPRRTASAREPPSWIDASAKRAAGLAGIPDTLYRSGRRRARASIKLGRLRIGGGIRSIAGKATALTDIILLRDPPVLSVPPSPPVCWSPRASTRARWRRAVP